jgi:ABC-type amino acid transport system permease subunit
MQETSVVGYLAIVDITRVSSIIASRTMDSYFSLIVVTLIYFLIGFAGKKLIDLMGNRKHMVIEG